MVMAHGGWENAFHATHWVSASSPSTLSGIVKELVLQQTFEPSVSRHPFKNGCIRKAKRIDADGEGEALDQLFLEQTAQTGGQAN
jgi:hypothetical protein